MSRIAAFLFAAALPAAAGPAFADAPGQYSAESPAMCASYAAHEKYLAQRYGEFPVFTGQLQDGVVFRLFANGKSGSWTMLLIRAADGVACVQGSGEGGTREIGI
jgi:hypothetical protein